MPPPSMPPPGGPPPFPPPPGPPGPGPHSGRGRAVWIALGAVGVLALVGVIVGLVLVLAGDDGDADRGDGERAAGPEKVVEQVVSAAEDGDCAAVERHLTERARASEPCASPEFRLLAGDDVDVEVGEASIDGATASVPVVFTRPPGSSTYLFTLDRVDGEWRVASYAVTRSTSTGTISPNPSTGASPSGAPSGTSTAAAVPDAPDAVVEAFLDAALRGDCATAEDLVTRDYLAENGRCAAAAIPTGLSDQVTYDIGEVRTDRAAGTAEVSVRITAFATSQDSVISLVREGGRWRISGAD